MNHLELVRGLLGIDAGGLQDVHTEPVVLVEHPAAGQRAILGDAACVVLVLTPGPARGWSRESPWVALTGVWGDAALQGLIVSWR